MSTKQVARKRGKSAATPPTSPGKTARRSAAATIDGAGRERRTDRSSRTAEALDKILLTAKQRHRLVAAVLSDASGLLIASTADHAGAERLAGLSSLFSTLRDYLDSYQVLEGLAQTVMIGRDGRGLVVWPFLVVGDNEVILTALFEQQPPPMEEIAEVVRGVRRIVESRAR